jgi:dTDP-4-dehydrorhamnose 3,5-epimerase-like enzyme
MPKKLSPKQRDEKIFKVEHPYEDARGRLDYWVMPQPVNWVGVATSKKGAVRANHWHPREQQKCLILSGKCVCVYKDLTKPDSPIKHHLAVEGDLVVTPPRVAHAVIYLEDTVFLNLVTGERDPTRWGTHTKAYPLVKPEDVARYAAMYGASLGKTPKKTGARPK